ncbi:rho GTPase-activating protein 29-like isoform X2 [Ptychodera flava]|uniref:rho GTPase-activating protein 29-like isoform X2 n=1 Tax=Ptychodera flava TaxID=63121 RepID=UPI00396A1EAA
MGFKSSRKNRTKSTTSMNGTMRQDSFGDSTSRQGMSSMGITPDSSPRHFGQRTRKISRSGIGSKASKSNSLSSLSSDCVDAAIMDQEDIIQLTQEVRNFSDALAKLKNIFHPDGERSETPRVAAHERLRELLAILRNVLNKYPALHSTDIHTAAVILISQIKGFTNEYDKENDHTEFYDAIDQLALAFSSSVSEYLMGDLDQSSPHLNASQSRSYDNLSSASWSSDGGSRDANLDTKEPVCMTPDELDNTLLSLESGVDLGLVRAKAWSKYAKDVMTYVEKRVHIETEFTRNLAKLAQTTTPILSEVSYLPLQSIYCTALQQDLEYASNCETTYNQVQLNKFLEPLAARRSEHDKKRKEIKYSWSKIKKEMADCRVNLEKAKQVYNMRQQEYDKAKEMTSKAETDGTSSSTGHAKIDKRRKIEEDALRKADEAETVYKSLIVEANSKQKDVQETKKALVTELRELIWQCDQTMKAVTVGYFQLMHSLSAPAPVQYQSLTEQCRIYEPGAQFSEFVRHGPTTGGKQQNTEPFTFEPYISQAKESPRPGLNRKTSSHSTSSTGSGELAVPEDWYGPSAGRPGNQKTDTKGEKSRTTHPLSAWGHTSQTCSDSESASGSSSRSQDASPSASPRDIKRKLPRETSSNLSSGDEVTDEPQSLKFDSRLLPSNEGKFKNSPQSKAAQTHVFRKLRAPSKCRECDSYVYFNGAECEHCSLSSHKKCLEYLAIQCGGKRLQGKMNVFGVNLRDHLQDTRKEVPFIVSKCISEINERALCVKGLYRVAGVKAKVEKLCQTFENGADLVDLSDTPPHLITSVFKLYLRQLPEPLLSFHLYPEFVAISKASNNYSDLGHERIVNLLKSTIAKLPEENLKATALVMQHLKKVADNADRNQMTASNLGIVFGPNLLRQSESAVTLSTLVEMPHQTRAIELLIHNSHIFGPEPEEPVSELDNRSHSQSSTEEREATQPVISVDHSEDVSGHLQPRLSLPGSSEDIDTMATHDCASDDSLDGATSTKRGNQGDGEDSDTDSDDADVVIPDATSRFPRRSATEPKRANPAEGAAMLHKSKSTPAVRHQYTANTSPSRSSSKLVPTTTRYTANTGQNPAKDSQASSQPRVSSLGSNGSRTRLSTGSSLGSSLEDELSGSSGSLPSVCTTPPKTLPPPAGYSPVSSKREPKFV